MNKSKTAHNERIQVSPEQARSILGVDGEYVHVFINRGNLLIGADWGISEIEKEIDNAEKLELAGENAQSFEHALVIYPKGAKYQSDLYFIKTDMDKFKKLEEELS